MQLRKIIKITTMVVAILGLGTVSTIAPDQTAQAATHHIKSNGKSYNSKYTISQIRTKYKLKYKRIKHRGWSETYNSYLGIVSNIHTGTWFSGKYHGGRKYTGHFIGFISHPAGPGMVRTIHWVNLKNGNLYKGNAQ